MNDGKRSDISAIAMSQIQMESSPLFQNWTTADKQALAASAREFQLAPGQPLFEQGKMGKWLYLVLSGSVKGVVLSEAGDEAIIDVAGSGHWIGGLSIVDNRPNLHSAIVFEAVHCVGFDGAVINRVLQSNPALYREIAFQLCDRLRSTYRWIELTLLSPVKKRIYIRLRQIAVGMGTLQDDGFIIRSRISQEVLAAMLGVTRQTLNKELGELKQAGLIKKIGAYYWIKCDADNLI